MKAAFYRNQLKKLLQMVEGGNGELSSSVQAIGVDELTNLDHFAKEKEMFSRQPLLVAHSSQIRDPGDYILYEREAKSWLIIRGNDGVARAFHNFCRHRGSKLLEDKSGTKKSISCPYHSWTYDNSGRLVGMPRSDLFPGIDKNDYGLKLVKLSERHGFLWLQEDGQTEVEVATYLGDLDDEFAALNLSQHHLYFDKTRSLNANWKLPLFAFLENYHIGTLHKESIAEFFMKNVAFSEQIGPHIRSLVPRKNVADLQNADLEEANVAEYVTPTNIVFPNICTIAHPTSYSVITVFPGEKPNRSEWRHMLLVPTKPSSDKEIAHYDKTIAVLDEMTYKNEDFWISEQIQKGIDAGAIDELLLATHEQMIKVFADNVSAAL